MLTSLIRLHNPTSALEPEDIFNSSLGLIFTDDLRNQHGDPGTTIIYLSSRFGPLEFGVADPNGEEERNKFAHYLWNAGVLMGELVGGRGEVGGRVIEEGARGEERGRVTKESNINGAGCMEDFRASGWWWVNEEEAGKWNVEGQAVLELGAGVGLAGIVSVLAGATQVTITDYPAPTILNTITSNVSRNVPAHLKLKVSIHGHQWGIFTTPFAVQNASRYTRILAADCLWMPWEHNNLARSMMHFLSPVPEARVFVIAGFHTGRTKLAPFFEHAVPGEGLEIEEIWEMDAEGRRREWRAARAEEPIGERKKWLVIARLRRRQQQQQQQQQHSQD